MRGTRCRTERRALAAFADPDEDANVVDASFEPAPVTAPVLVQQQESRIHRSGDSRVVRLVAIPESGAQVTVTMDGGGREDLSVTADGNPAEIDATPAQPVPRDPSSEPTLGVSAISARFGEGLSMTRAYIELVLRVPADGESERKLPLWSERSACAIAERLSQRATEVACR